MSKFAEQVKSWYAAGHWNRKMVDNALKKGKISAGEHAEITGEADSLAVNSAKGE